jgi:hypothetical protein
VCKLKWPNFLVTMVNFLGMLWLKVDVSPHVIPF